MTHGTTADSMASVSFYIRASDRARARNAYRGTAEVETDHSWSDFLTKAILQEVSRREQLHNAGEPFDGSDEPLRPGRGNRRGFACRPLPH